MGGDFTGRQQNSAKGIYALAGRAATIHPMALHTLCVEGNAKYWVYTLR